LGTFLEATFAMDIEGRKHCEALAANSRDELYGDT